MNPIVTSINLYIGSKATYISDLSLVEGDSGLTRLHIRIFHENEELDYASAADIGVIFIRPDGVRVKRNVDIAVDGIRCTIGAKETAVPGLASCAVQFSNGKNGRLTSSSFTFNILRDMAADLGDGEPGAPEEYPDPPSAVDASFFMPETIYAAAGSPMELYSWQIFRGLIPDAYAVYYNSPLGRTYKRKWFYMPAAEEMPSVHLAIEARDRSGKIVASTKTKIQISAPSPATSPMTLMLIGDSISNPGNSPHLYSSIRDYAKAICGSQGGVLEMVGTRGAIPNRHEAVSGSIIQSFLKEGTANSFWDSATGRTNFAAYTKRTGIQPDIVHLMLGTNNAYVTTSDNTSKIEEDTDAYVQLVGYLRQDWPSTCILAGLMPIPANQDIAEEYRLHQKEYREQDYVKSVHLYAAKINDKLLKAYAGDNQLKIVPHTVMMDREFGYGFQTITANPFSEDEIQIPADFLHPQKAGQKQMAAAIVGAWAAYARDLESGITITNMLSSPLFDDMSKWTNMNSSAWTVSALDGIVTLTGRGGATASAATLLQTGKPFIEGHKIYIRAMHKCSHGDQSYVYSQGIQIGGSIVAYNKAKSTDYVPISGIITLTPSHITSPWYGLTISMLSAQDTNGMTISRMEPLCVDLTEAFGIGEEPSVGWCDENIPFFTGSMII